MANEITVLEGDGEETYSFVFGYLIASPKQVAGVNIVVTPSAGLPDIAASVFTQAEKDALDAGVGAFEVVRMSRNVSLTVTEFQAAVQAEYAKHKAAFDTNYAAMYEYAGMRFDAS